MSLPQRQCRILQGDHQWLLQQANRAYEQAPDNARCWLSNETDRPQTAIGHKQALQQLGRDNRLIVFDARGHFHADAFGALIGTLTAGGLMLILLPAETGTSLWLQRFLSIAGHHAAIRFICQGDSLPDPVFDAGQSAQPVAASNEQKQAIEAVLRVVKGHRRRPLVISADRGRGKTALLGMAAADLLKQGKQKILVTAPAAGNIQPLLQHAAIRLDTSVSQPYRLDWQQGHIEFIAPDALLASKPEADLLMVDEAAAIPAAMLEQMLKAYSRIVFATTMHGYEGTGRGFALRFKKTLDQLTPNWRGIGLQQPVRWADNDKLEQFSFEALLLDAEAVDDALVAEADDNNTRFEFIDRHSLARDDRLLRQVFGLMVLAHYRTRPSDLQMLLDREDVSTAVLRYRGHIVASAWLVEEPPLSEQLAQQVFAGERRLKGRLLPQSLLAHAGLTEAGRYHYQRVIRIAVHPALQNQGLGSELLAQLQLAVANNADLLGSSFAMETGISRFWLKNGFVPVRLGQHRDEVTGSRSLMLLKAVSPAGSRLLDQAQTGLSRQWPFLLQTRLQDLEPEQVLLLSSALPFENKALPADLQQQVISFAGARRDYESTQFALWQWLQNSLSAAGFAQLDDKQQSLLVMLLLQQRSIRSVAERLGLTGRAAVVKALRQAVWECLPSNSPVETR